MKLIKIILGSIIAIAAVGFVNLKQLPAIYPEFSLDLVYINNIENELNSSPGAKKIDFVKRENMIASWYGPKFHGKLTANGEIYDQMAFTAAHKTLPFGTLLRVTNLKNNKSVIVRINDRGPYIKGRNLDLSKSAAMSLGMMKKGVIKVKTEELSLNQNFSPILVLN